MVSSRDNSCKLMQIAGQWILECGYLNQYFHLEKYSENDVLELKDGLIKSSRDEVFDIEVHGKNLMCVLIACKSNEFYLKKTHLCDWVLICKGNGKETMPLELKNCASVELCSSRLVADTKQYLLQRNTDGSASLSLIQDTNFVDRSNPGNKYWDQSWSPKRFFSVSTNKF